jgi:hypothetical protein
LAQPDGNWYFEGPEDARLRLPDYIKSVVCFLCVEKEGRTYYGGTAFFVTLESKRHPELVFTYLVTAKHCVLTAYGKYGHLKTRINLTNDRPAAVIDLPNKWVFSDDPSVDAAVLLIGIEEGFDVLCLESEHFANEQNIEEFGVGIGDEIVMVGLFTQRQGKTSNIPIVRSGTIAAMPDELLFDSKTGAEFHAYLIEVRSIGGLSGSPVFARIPPYRSMGRNEQKNEGYCMAIGLIHGHWDIDATKADDSLDDFLNDGRINMGIASVTPIQEVTKILMENEALKKARQIQERQLEEEQGPTLDSGFESPRDNVFTRSDFESALKKVSRKIEPEK